VDGIVNGVTGIAEKVADFVRKIPGAIGNFAQEVFGAAKRIAERIVDGLGNGLTGLVQKVIDKFQDLWGWIKGAASSAATFAANVGKAIVEGIWDGISGLGGWLKDKIGGFLGGLLPDIDIPFFSPPRHASAEAVGRPMGKGIAEGIEAEGPTVTRAMQKVVSDGIAAAASLSGTSGFGPGSFATGMVSNVSNVVNQNAALTQSGPIRQAAQAAIQRALIPWFANRPSPHGPTGGLESYYPYSVDFMGDQAFRAPFDFRILQRGPGGGPGVGGHQGYSGGLGGRSMYIIDGKGRTYFVTHMDWESTMGLRPGMTFKAGQLVAGGGAEPNANHIHFGFQTEAARAALLAQGGMVRPGAGVQPGAFTNMGSQAIEQASAALASIGGKLGSQFNAIGDTIKPGLEKAAQRISETVEKIKGMFGGIKDRALAAFDRMAEEWQSPARKLLEANQKAHDERLRQEERHALELAVQQATTDEERLNAQRQLDEFMFQESQRALEEQAVAEEAAHAKETERDRNRLEKDLNRWIKHLGDKKTNTRTAMKELREIFERAGLEADEGFMKNISPVLGKLRKLIADMKGAAASGSAEIAGAAAGAGGGGAAPAPVPQALSNLQTGGNQAAQPTKAQVAAARAIAVMNHENRSPAQKDALAAFNAYFGPVGNWLHLLAEGGVITQPTLAVVGEKGPEWVIPAEIMEEFLKGRFEELEKVRGAKRAMQAALGPNIFTGQGRMGSRRLGTGRLSFAGIPRQWLSEPPALRDIIPLPEHIRNPRTGYGPNGQPIPGFIDPVTGLPWDHVASAGGGAGGGAGMPGIRPGYVRIPGTPFLVPQHVIGGSKLEGLLGPGGPFPGSKGVTVNMHYNRAPRDEFLEFQKAKFAAGAVLGT
jgi:hypothetical protein